MAYTSKRVYPLQKGTTKTLPLGAKQFLALDALALTNPVDVLDFATVSGTITSNGTTPVSGAYVSLKIGTEAIGTNPLYGTKTDAEGKYYITIPQSTLSSYTLSVIATGYLNHLEDISVATQKITKDITLSADTELATSAKAILGKVTTGSDPVGSAFVTLYNDTTVVGVTVTNATGEYAFIGLNNAISAYSIVVSHSLYNTETVTPIEFTADAFITKNVSLTAIQADSSKLIQGTITPAAEDITVILYKHPTSGDDVPIAFTKTNANGYYSFLVNYDSQTDADTQYYVVSTNNTIIP